MKSTITLLGINVSVPEGCPYFGESEGMPCFLMPDLETLLARAGCRELEVIAAFARSWWMEPPKIPDSFCSQDAPLVRSNAWSEVCARRADAWRDVYRRAMEGGRRRQCVE